MNEERNSHGGRGRARPHPWLRRLTWAVVALALLLVASVAAAQDASRPVTVEYFQGPVVSSNRIIGMGGAFIGVARGADAHLINPASFASRYDYSLDDWFDYDWALSWVTRPGGGNAALNVSPVAVDVEQSRALDFGFDLKFGRFGIGLHGASQQFDDHVAWSGEDGRARSELVTWHQSGGGGGLGYAFLDGELVVGVASETVALRLEGVNLPIEEQYEVNSSQLSAGVLVAPHGADWRVGARFRSATLGDSLVQGKVDVFELPLEPRRVVAPWEVGVGASWRFGEREYNPKYRFEDDASVQLAHAHRRYVLVASDVILTGTSEQAIGIESFLTQEFIRAGESMTFGARLGVESEVVANLLRLRAGSYFEPSRYRDTNGRLHATFGADLRVKLGWQWRLNTAVDIAPGYRNVGLGIGFWH